MNDFQRGSDNYADAVDCYRCRSVMDFEKLQCVGKGTYGTVYKARDKATGEIVALKKLRMSHETEGFPITSIREIKILKSLNHENIVRLKDVVVGSKSDSIFLVFEYCDHDFASLMDNMKKKFTESEVKCILLQVIRSIHYLHSRFIFHRDLKLSNLLMTSNGIMKLADFGLARLYGNPLEAYTPKVVTLWYRAPEILLGMAKYHTAADCWALGCMFGELLNHRPLLPGNNDLEQLKLIYKLLGAPNERIWPGFSSLPHSGIIKYPEFIYNNINSEFPQLSEKGLQLMKGLLCFDPSKRLTAEEALNHPYFSEHPLPKLPEMMPTFPTLTHSALRDAALQYQVAAPLVSKRKMSEEEIRKAKK